MSNHKRKLVTQTMEFHPPTKIPRIEWPRNPECELETGRYTIENHTIVSSPTIFSRLGQRVSPANSSVYNNYDERCVNLHEHSSPGDANLGHKFDQHLSMSHQQHPVKHRRLSHRRKYVDPRKLPLSDDMCLHELANSETVKIVEFLAKHGRERELGELLKSKDATSGSITLTLLVKIFAKLGVLLSSGGSQQPSSLYVDRKLKEIMRCLIENSTLGGFYVSLSSFLCQMPMEGSITKRKELLPILYDTITMCNVLLDIYPGETSRNLSIIDTCIGAATQLGQQQIIFQELSEKAQQLLRKRNNIRTESYELNCESHHEQTFSVVLPHPQELHQDVLMTLRENIISGAFPDAPTYLSTQFKLLREDFLNPLRKALRIVYEADDDDESHSVVVYHDVHFDKGRTFTFSGIAYKISFRTPLKINWNRSKKLQYGSLVCLSTDNFQSVLYATIVERNTDDLNKGITSIQLQNCPSNDEIRLSQSMQFSMIESPGYYEAYAPVLKRLHAIEPTELPFKNYLVELNTEVTRPNYLKHVQPMLDLKGIVCNCTVLQCEHQKVDILDEVKWDALPTPLLDLSQKRALHVALTNEMALIQGPPGTGKTYVGLKVVETLIRNKYLWRIDNFLSEKCPIIVICYTNHALDQFLEGILHLQLKIQVRRIGSRTKSDTIRNLNLQGFVHRYCREHRIFNPMKSREEKQKMVEAMDEIINGRFCKEKSRLYCYFLSRYVVEDIEESCKLKLSYATTYPGQGFEYGEFASWLDPALQKRILDFCEEQNLEDNDYLFKADNDARREMSNTYSCLPEVHDIFEALHYDGIKNFIQKFGNVEPLTKVRAQEYLTGQYDDEAEGHIRLQLFKYCLKQLHLVRAAELKCCIKKQEKYDKDMQLIKLRCLQKADVIGLTTTTAARDNALISQLQSKIMIVEEAAEVLEPQLIASLTKHTQHVILIGDHKQLRPKTIDHIIGRKYLLEISLFERLVKNYFPHATLTVQHRMRPEISQIVSHHIYNGTLHDHENTLDYENVKGMKHNIFFVDHCHAEDPNPDLKSPANKHEAEFLTALCYYLLQQGYLPHQITVITPYVGQMFELRSQFRNRHISNVRVTPIDSYQGEENDIILLSLVRSKRPGFVKDENRVCVALSRAKKGLYCIGNFALFSKSCKLWEEISQNVCSRQLLSNRLPLQCAKHSNISLVSSAADFENVADGGCQELCRKRLPCNHVCKRNCHPDDETHLLPCKEPCPKRCTAGLHRCKRLCHEQCGDCKELVERIVDRCGHNQNVPCYIQPKDIICQFACTKKLKCGHACKNKCGEKCTTKCTSLVEKVLSCGHTQKVECYLDPKEAAKRCKHPCEDVLACGHTCSGTCGRCHQSRLHVPCRDKCTRILFCGHPCSSDCGRNCPPCRKRCMYECQHGPCDHYCDSACRPCPHECKWNCDHYQCSRNCGEICDRPRCNEKCPLQLPECGHPCIGVCGEPCPDVCRQCLSQEDFESKIPFLFGDEHDDDAQFVVLEDCGHVLEVKALDRWMDQVDVNEEIKWKCCPLCKAPVLKTARYSNITKAILQDMNKIKEKKQQLSICDRKEMREKLSSISIANLQHENLVTLRQDFSSIQWREFINSLSDVALQKAYTMFLSAHEVLKTKANLQHLLCQLSSWQSSKPLTVLLSQAEEFLHFIKCHKHREMLTDQMTIDINAERRRILLLEASLKTLLAFKECHTGVDEDDKQLFAKILSYETIGNRIQKLTEDSEYDRMMKQLQGMPNKYRVPLTIEERSMIIKAIGAKPGSWYKCPNGHYYQIGECGGAMQISKCPECSSQIGGHNHQLLSSNQHASEFDDSRHAAWSEGANMLNFDL